MEISERYSPDKGRGGDRDALKLSFVAILVRCGDCKTVVFTLFSSLQLFKSKLK